MQHLESMEYLRGSVNLRAYGQRDPLIEYRKEGLSLYREMESELAGRVFDIFEKMRIDVTTGMPVMPAIAAPASQTVTLNIPSPASVAGNRGNNGDEIGRNDPCPCGSGKKWKNCGLKNTAEHQRLISEKTRA